MFLQWNDEAPKDLAMAMSREPERLLSDAEMDSKRSKITCHLFMDSSLTSVRTIRTVIHNKISTFL